MSFVHPSSWSNRRQRDYAGAVGRARWVTEDEDLEAEIDAAVTAVAELLPHLDRADILHPPHAWFDAALARQMVVHVLVEEFGAPKRVVSAVSLMNREAIVRGLRVIDRRLQSPAFARTMARIRDRAADILSERVSR
jgi:hypothetical protein